ncbi:MAG: hypothetical protein V4466_05090 [Pseudomonadota bacterium]
MSFPFARIAAHVATVVPLRPFDQQLDRMLDLAQATPLSVIAVAGPEAAEAMSGLWRRGYPRVEAARRATCPSADELCDVMLIAGYERAIPAAACVCGTRAMLGPRARVVIDAGHMTDPDERLRLCGLLAEEGFRVQRGAHLAPEIVASKAV